MENRTFVPLRLACAVAIVAIVHISVIVFVFLKAVRMNSHAKP
jgi:hypothetical protein